MPDVKQKAQIISVSRRTDIPAFYSRWFISRVRQGFVDIVNPFHAGQVSRVSLQPQDVLGFIFWTRNPAPLLKYLPELRAQGYRFYFQWTLNRYPRLLERKVPEAYRMIELMHRVAEQFSPDHLQWRYDPIILNDAMPPAWHEENFAFLAEQLAGATRRCLFSFVDMYQKTRRQLAATAGLPAVWPRETAQERTLAGKLQKIAQKYNMQLLACCEAHLLDVPGIGQAHCVDLDLLRELYPDLEATAPRKPTREACGCSASKDIGAYDSCLFQCRYCYANANFTGRSVPRYQRHDPQGEMLIPR